MTEVSTTVDTCHKQFKYFSYYPEDRKSFWARCWSLISTAYKQPLHCVFILHMLTETRISTHKAAFQHFSSVLVSTRFSAKYI